ncbi:MAG: hypothetical protein CMJ58_05255 [Planctomycetaceae bacterium]|nr:hypothetical protein [Planctomycetaceae bacterium]
MRLAVICLLVSVGCSDRRQSTAVKSIPPIAAEDVAALRNEAAGLMGQFKYDDAAARLTRLEKSAHATDEIRVDLAIALLNRREGDDLQRAAKLLDAVIAASPDDARANYCRGLLWFHEGATDKALAAFQKVADFDPADSHAAYYVGQCHLGNKDFEQALAWFRKAGEMDPYLRSAPYGEAQALRRLGDAEGAKAALALFQQLGTNPRARVAELKYTRMGPKAEVRAGQILSTPAPSPEGPVFGDAKAALVDSPARVDAGAANTTVADINGDGVLDLFVADAAATVVLLGDASGSFAASVDHPLAGISDVNAALWGDFDDDGLIDAYLCRRGPNQLWRQVAADSWEDVAKSAVASGGDADTRDGACYDFDHDGDLDYLLLNRNSSPELLSNNRDGTFRSIAAELGLDTAAMAAQSVVIADLDRDDDADLVFINENGPHAVLRNDRLWRYSQAANFDVFSQSKFSAAMAVDADVDGQAEIYTTGPEGVERWTPDDSGEWKPRQLASEPASQLLAYDFDGDTATELVAVGDDAWAVLNAITGAAEGSYPLDSGGSHFAVRMSANGPELLRWTKDGDLQGWQAGSGRWPFVHLNLTGKTDRALEMRSNASGIGVIGAARIGERWAPLPGVRVSSAAGQGLQPRAIGIADATAVDFLRLLWPDGVSQTERNLAPGKLLTIPETQRQAGSCPLLFVWDGAKFAFVADLLGAGGIGFNLGRGEYYPSRPEERFLLPQGILQPRDGRLAVKLGEPMEEVCYFDAVRLTAYDLPPGWSMTLDERFAGLGPAPTGEAIFYQRELLPAVAVNDRGADVTAALQAVDGEPAPLVRRDHRFIGLTERHHVTIDFEEPLDRLADPVLVFDGWVEYAYSQSAFAAWQAGEEFIEPTIEAQAADGTWQVVAERFGYPAGTSRQGAVALPKDSLPADARRLRISTNMQVYWDRLAVVDRQPCPEARQIEVTLQTALVDDVGFSAREVNAHRRSVYDYSDRPPFGDARHPAGYYTAFGEATELVAATDDALAIIGPGEELHLEFAAPSAEPPSGWTRRWVLDADGWCKDADLFTRNAGTVEPLPRRSNASDETHRRKLHEKYNTRFRSGY